jgi:inactivated superfamily I helicase
LLEELLERGIVERRDAEVEEHVEKLVARDQITRREPLERHIDEIDEPLRHGFLRSLRITVADGAYPNARARVTGS